MGVTLKALRRGTHRSASLNGTSSDFARSLRDWLSDGGANPRFLGTGDRFAAHRTLDRAGAAQA